MKTKKALVLEGGGSLGAVQVGMLYALVRYGFRPDFVVGSSVGAINGGFFASAGSEQCVERLERVWRKMTMLTLFPFRVDHLARALTGKRAGLFPSSGLERLVRENLPYERFEDAAIPAYAVTTELKTGLEFVLSTGDAAEAIITSASIPVVFAPRLHGDKLCVDGGVAANSPVDIATDLGATEIVVAPTGYNCGAAGAGRNVMGTLVQTLVSQTNRQLIQQIRSAHERGVAVRIIPPLCPVGVAPYDFSKTGQLIERGEASTKAWLESGGLEAPSELLPHYIVAELHGHDPKSLPVEAM